MHEERIERRKNAPKKTILEMYRTIGAVNGPGWRPIPPRPLLETSLCLAMDSGPQLNVSVFRKQICYKEANCQFNYLLD